MKKISGEIITGFIALITIIVFIWLFSFLKGNNLFVNNDRYYAVFEDIGGLDESSPVEINGYKAGIVRDIEFLNDGSGRILVSLGINKGYKLPQGTVAQISPETILAGMKVELLLGENTVNHNNGDTLISRLYKGIAGQLENQIPPLIDKAENMISDIDTVIRDLKLVMNNEFRENISNSAENLNSLTANMDDIMQKSGHDIRELISNLKSFSDTLKSNSEQFGNSIRQFSEISSEMSEAKIKELLDNINSSAEQTKIMLEKLNAGKGSAGLMLNDDSLYIELTSSLEELNYILDDLRKEPGKYFNFSVFGGKDRK